MLAVAVYDAAQDEIADFEGVAVSEGVAVTVGALEELRVKVGVFVADDDGGKNVTFVPLRYGLSKSNTETACSKWRVQRFPIRTAGPSGRPSGLNKSGYQTLGAAQVSELPQ